MDGSCTPRKITSGSAKLGVTPCIQCVPMNPPSGPSTRYRFDCTRINKAAIAKKPRFLIAFSMLRARLLGRRGAGLALFRVGQDDEHLFEPREVDRRLGFDRLVDAEIAFFDLFHARDRDAA